LQTHQRSRTSCRQSKVVNVVKRTSLVATFGLLYAVSVFGSSGSTGAEAQTQHSCPEPEIHYGANDEVSTASAPYHYVSQARQARLARRGFAVRRSGPCRASITSHAVVLSNNAQLVRAKLLDRRARLALRKLRTAPVRRVVKALRRQPVGKLIAVARRDPVPQAVTHVTNRSVNNAAAGRGNPFPYGQCTWWAAQRYYQLHGVFVPWRIEANAWQWTDRAYQFGWRVSFVPQAGDIIVLQPGVQGAYEMGHVGIVEHVFPGGRLMVSSMNWGANTGGVTDTQFHTGPGVAFISQ
jgi:surface antigen